MFFHEFDFCPKIVNNFIPIFDFLFFKIIMISQIYFITSVFFYLIFNNYILIYELTSKDLLKNPYEKLIEMLIAGPENNLYESAIPNDTKVISTQLNNECLTVDLSKEFLNISNENNEIYNAIYQIVDTVTELKEVNRVKLLVEGEDSESYLKNEYVRTN